MTLRTRLTGLLAALMLVLGIIGFPGVLIAIDAIPSPDVLSADRLTAPDDGSLAITIVALAAWGAWVSFTASVLIEVVARARRVPTPRVPGLSLPQLTAGRLVALASLLFVTAPVLATSVDVPRAAATPAPPEIHSEAAVEAVSAPPPKAVPQGNPSAGEAPTPSYVVRRGDSLWRIAERHLGDGRRYGELVALNRDILQDKPDFLQPGTTLRVPTSPPGDPGDPGDETEVIVHEGDTLSSIAADLLGDADRYPEIVRQSRPIEQPDGQRLVDPDLIRPGWHLAVPDARVADAQDPKPEHLQRPRTAEPDRPRVPFDPSSLTTSGGTDTEVEVTPDDDVADHSWVLPGLSGAGGALAAALLLTLQRHRRTQARYRRPGKIIAPPPIELRDVEKSAHLTGSVTAPLMDALDRCLRVLVRDLGHRPEIRLLTLSAQEVRLTLVTDADLPAPWTGSGIDWHAPLRTGLAIDPQQVAPYPMLVSVGRDHNDELVLVDLEALGTVTLTGDVIRAGDLGRHLAAELAVNPWAELVEVDTLGIAGELADIDPIRMRHHSDDDVDFLDRLASTLDVDASDDPERLRTLVTSHVDAPGVARAMKVIAARSGRTGVAMVLLGGPGTRDEPLLELTADGRLLGLPIDGPVTAAGLTSCEASTCAAILDVTREARSVPSPAGSISDLTTLAGAVRDELTNPRPEGPAGEDSLLPQSTDRYLASAATTAEDIETLAPVIPPPVGDRIASADPTLDDDLARWLDEDCLVPRLRLLGPVDARAFGNPRAVAKRKPFYVELLSYLSLHPAGASSAEVADAFGLTTPRTRVDVGVLRSWLGDDPRSGEPHLPNAEVTRATSGHGARRYQVRGVLTDLDLFRRLRARGQARGEQGIADLRAALELVSGEPFSHLRPAGWSWLLDGDRIDHIMTCAVADVSHLLTTWALERDDVETARHAAETGHRAAPSDETCRLDLIQVAAAAGHADLAAERLASQVLNRTDDGLGPVELPARTEQLLHDTRTRGQQRIHPSRVDRPRRAPDGG